MNENHELWNTLSGYRKKNPAGFEKLVGSLLGGTLEQVFERLEASSLTPEQIRNCRNPTEADNTKLEAFYAIIQARNVLYWDEKENREFSQLIDESDDIPAE